MQYHNTNPKKKFLQKLLPFLLQTEEFTTFARRNQHGSTNPFLNWKDIAKFEFHLPSLDEQKEIEGVFVGSAEEFQEEFTDIMVRHMKPQGDA